jgi:hypothetical protein
MPDTALRPNYYETCCNAVSLVNLSIELDNCAYVRSPRFPLQHVMQLEAQIKKNKFALEMLRMLILKHFYLFPDGRWYREKQQTCDLLNISYDKLPKTHLAAGRAG